MGTLMGQPLPAAAGYPQMAGNSVMFPPLMSAKTLQRFWSGSFLPFITTTDYFGELSPAYGRCLRFKKEPIVKVRRRHKNQKAKHNVLQVLPHEVTIGNQLEYSYKIDDFDKDALWSDAEYQGMIQNGAAKSAHEVVTSEIMNYLVTQAACENQGNNAGKNTRMYQMGDAANPHIININNAADIYTTAQGVLAEQNIIDGAPTPLGSNITLLVPPVFRNIFIRSNGADRILNAQCPSACSMLFDGTMPTQLIGMNTIVTNCIPTVMEGGAMNFYIIAIAKAATGFQGLMEKSRITDGGKDDPWSTYYQGLFTYGFETFYPEAVAVFYVRFEM